MNILVTGGTGFIGRALIAQLLPSHRIYCHGRKVARIRECFGDSVVAIDSYEQLADVQIEAVINLAGAGIADQRWSEPRKQLLRSSRIDGTRKLVEWMSQQAQPPAVLISGSAIGYYGSHLDDTPLNEQATVVDGFTHALCRDWEAAALEAEKLGTRVCLIRTGVVVGPGGGALAKMLPPFRLGLGGPVGQGGQWMSWIHLDDEIAAITHLLESADARGAYNLTSPEAVTNGDFSRMLARTLHRPAWFAVPPFVIRLMLGQGAELLLEGQRVVPDRLQAEGFEFRYPKLSDAFTSFL